MSETITISREQFKYLLQLAIDHTDNEIDRVSYELEALEMRGRSEQTADEREALEALEAELAELVKLGELASS